MNRKRIPVSFDNSEQSKREPMAIILFTLSCSLSDKKSAEIPKRKYKGSFNPDIYAAASTFIGWTKKRMERKREIKFIFGSRMCVPLMGEPYFLKYFIFALPERLFHSFSSSSFGLATILPKRAFNSKYKIIALSICKAIWNT